MTLVWTTPTDCEVGGTTFCADPVNRFASTPDRFCVVKRPDLVMAYVDLLERLRPSTIVELGVFNGGSTALLAALTRPERFLALELSEPPVAALTEYLAREGMADSVRVEHGVDQADTATVSTLLDDTFGDRPLDLVIDDASHEVGPTRASFNVLFPRLRPGGLFVLEDWSWAHLGYGLHRPDSVPLTVLVFELIMALPTRIDVIRSVTIDRDWAVVERGDAPLSPDPYDLAASYSDRGRALVAPLAAEGMGQQR